MIFFTLDIYFFAYGTGYISPTQAFPETAVSVAATLICSVIDTYWLLLSSLL